MIALGGIPVKGGVIEVKYIANGCAYDISRVISGFSDQDTLVLNGWYKNKWEEERPLVVGLFVTENEPGLCGGCLGSKVPL